MREITAGYFISLDGVVESPQNWHFPYMDEQMGQWVAEQGAGVDTMLYGRVTYEEFAAVWPFQTGDLADLLNGIPKYVASTTLDALAWQNSTLLGDDPIAAITELKAGPGKNISVTGSTTLVRELLHHGLVDELTLMVHPIVLGSGRRLFEPGDAQLPLTLTDSATSDKGVVKLTYRLA